MVDSGYARDGVKDSQHHIRKGRLARATAPHDGETRAGWDVDADTLECVTLRTGVAHRDVSEFNRAGELRVSPRYPLAKRDWIRRLGCNVKRVAQLSCQCKGGLRHSCGVTHRDCGRLEPQEGRHYPRSCRQE